MFFIRKCSDIRFSEILYYFAVQCLKGVVLDYKEDLHFFQKRRHLCPILQLTSKWRPDTAHEERRWGRDGLGAGIKYIRFFLISDSPFKTSGKSPEFLD